MMDDKQLLTELAERLEFEAEKADSKATAHKRKQEAEAVRRLAKAWK